MMIDGGIAIVTGGSSGLGRATALALAQSGVRVAVLGQDQSRCDEVAAQTNGIGIAVDVTDRSAMRTAIDRIVAELGRPDILVACAGIPGLQPFLADDADAAYENMRRTIAVNLDGTINAASLFAEARAQGVDEPEEASIIMVSSGAAYEGIPGAAAYSAAKGGINSLTLALAREFSPLQIRVNTICPGPIATPLLGGLPEELVDRLVAGIPYPRRAGSPEEFAALAIHICQNSYLNGSIIRFDGAYRSGA